MSLFDDSSSGVSRPRTSMFWTEEHDKRLCGEIRLIDPFTGTKKGTVQRGQKWDEVASNLSKLEYPKFKVDKRGVRERYNLLSQRYRKKIREEERASGVDPEMSEVEAVLEDIIEIEDMAEAEQDQQSSMKRKKSDEDKQNAEKIRHKAMEKLSETQKRTDCDDDNDQGKKKRKSSGQLSDSITYIREKNEKMARFKEEEIELKKKELELENKKHEGMMQLMMQQQHQHQMQLQKFQAMMMAMFEKLAQK